MNTEIWDRLSQLTETRVNAEKAEKEWQTFLKSLVAKGEKGPFTKDGEERFIYPVKGGSLSLSKKRTGPGKKTKKEVVAKAE